MLQRSGELTASQVTSLEAIFEILNSDWLIMVLNSVLFLFLL